MPLLFDESDILDSLESRFIERGRAYFRQGKVLSWSANTDGRKLQGQVAGSRRTPYRVFIHVWPRRNGADIEGECTCPVGYDCKHVAAVLFAALAAKSDSVEETAPEAPPVDGWLQQLNQAVAPEPAIVVPAEERYPPTVKRRLLYILDVRQTASGPALHLELLSAYLLKNGSFGNATAYNPASIHSTRPAAHILPSDQAILKAIDLRSRQQAIPWNRLTGDVTTLLQAMLATGRCRWQDKNGPVLHEGRARQAEPAWSAPDDHGRQRPTLELGSPGTVVLPVSPPWYVDPENGECGPLETELTPALLAAWTRSPPVSPEEIATVSERLASLPVKLPLPRPIEVETIPTTPPRPYIRLGAVEQEPEELHLPPWMQADLQDLFPPLPYLQLAFDYGDLRLPPDEGDKASFDRFENGRLVRMQRDREAETRAMQYLRSRGLTEARDLADDDPELADLPPGVFVAPAYEEADEETIWLDFMLDTLPDLQAEGWRVEIEDSFPYRIAEVADWHLDLEEQPDNHWFDLDLGIEVDGERVPLLPILLDAFEHFTPEMRAQLREVDEEHKTLYTLEDGRILPLPTRRVARILDVLVELFDRDGGLEKDGRLRLSEWRAAELADLTRREPELHWRGGERLRSLAERLQAFDRIEPVAPPEGFRAELRHYQQEGLGWLQFLREAELHGILADDMGLGKTVQALAHILAEKRAGRLDRPALVVAPTSLMHNWRQEASHFAPELSVLTLHGTGRKQHYDSIADHDVVLTTYPLLPRDEEILLGHTFHILILDEAQQIKNPKAKAAQVARRLDARQRICLTGTPLENHLGELWSLFHFLMPGLLGDERQFRRLFRNPIEKHGDAERAQRLARRVAPFMLRRTKEQVATELPPKTEIVHSVPLTGAQRDLYESIRLTLHGKVREAIARQGLKRSHIVVLDALLKLRQICCDPRLLKIDAARKVKRSAKLELLMELLPELLDEGRRILLFSQFTTMLGLIEDELKARGIDYVKLTGKTKNRAKPIERFQNGEVPLFLISLKAGGTGLNLTAADTVIHYDPWWNPAVENQATDRAHRIGQDKPVFVYKLLTEGTVEERIQEMQARKRKLADNLFAGADHGKLPGAEEIAELFGPLE